MNLEESRKIIDEIDERLIKAFIERMETTKAIAEYKKANGLPTRDRERELAILKRKEEQAGETFAPYTRELYEKLFELSRNYQDDLRGSKK